MSPRRAVGGVAALALLLVVWAFVTSMVTIVIAFGIWPGELALTAPLVCPDDRPDAFVVSDTVQPAPGESSTTFTVVCLGEGGEQTDAGLMRPFAIVTGVHGAALLALGVVVLVALRLRR